MSPIIGLWKPPDLTEIGVAKLEMPVKSEKWRPIDLGAYETRRQPAVVCGDTDRGPSPSVLT